MEEVLLNDQLMEELRGEFNKIIEKVMKECSCSKLDALSIIVREMYLVE